MAGRVGVGAGVGERAARRYRGAGHGEECGADDGEYGGTADHPRGAGVVDGRVAEVGGSGLGDSGDLLVGDACLEVLSDAVRYEDDGVGVLGGHDLVGGLGEEGEPAVEVLGVEGEREVDHHGVAFVASSGEHDGGPEVLELGEMEGPVVDHGVEDGTNHIVAADFGVETVYEVADLFFGDSVAANHEFSVMYLD